MTDRLTCGTTRLKLQSRCPINPLAGECRRQSLTIQGRKIDLDHLLGREDDGRPTLLITGWGCAGDKAVELNVVSTGPCVAYQDRIRLDLTRPGQVIPKASIDPNQPEPQMTPLSLPRY